MYKNVFLPSIYLNTRVVFRQMMPHVCNTMEKSTKINNWHLKKKSQTEYTCVIHILQICTVELQRKTVNLRSYSGKSGTQYATFR